MPLRAIGPVPAPRLAELAEFLRGQHITDQVLRAAQSIGCDITDVHRMDEYTHDVVVPLPDGLVLIYDTT